MHDDACPVRRGDAFILPDQQPLAFGVVLSVRPAYGAAGAAFVQMQSGMRGWCALPLVERGRALAQEFAVEGFA